MTNVIPLHPEHDAADFMFGGCPECREPLLGRRGQSEKEMWRIGITEYGICRGCRVHWVIAEGSGLLSPAPPRGADVLAGTREVEAWYP